jgi:hypothetical protein
MTTNNDQVIDSHEWREQMEFRLQVCLQQTETLHKAAPDLAHTWRFAVGAIYALLQRVRIGKSDEDQITSDQSFVPRTTDLFNALRDNNFPEPEWLAGLWYNTAVMRLDALYERCVRALLLNKEYAKAEKLYKKLLVALPSAKIHLGKSYNEALWSQVRDEVNGLKHYTFGARAKSRMETERTAKALEQLLRFLLEPRPRAKLVANHASGTVRSGTD